MVLINQDTDAVIKIDNATVISCVPHIARGTYCGWNLYASKTFLGNYDYFEEAFEQMNNIRSCKAPIYNIR